MTTLLALRGEDLCATNIIFCLMNRVCDSEA